MLSHAEYHHDRAHQLSELCNFVSEVVMMCEFDHFEDEEKLAGFPWVMADALLFAGAGAWLTLRG